MRKVKVLAFVLAALMVVAAFAGCGTKQLKTDVSTLDERVTALETLLKQVSETVNGGATKDDITEILDAITANKAEAAAGDKTLADAIAKITADQATALEALKKDLEADDDDLQKALESLTKSLEETNKAIQANKTSSETALANAINDLNKAIEALKTSQGETDKNQDAKIDALIESLNKSLADLSNKLDELDKNTAAQTSLDALKESYIDLLESKEADLSVNSTDYTSDELNKLTSIISAGKTNIRVAADEAKVVAAYDATFAEISKYIPMADQLAMAVDAKLGAVKHDTNLTTLTETYNKAVNHYTVYEGNTNSLTKYGADGKRNLVAEYEAIVAAKAEAAVIKTRAEAIVAAVKTVKDAGGVILGTNNAVVAAQYNAYLALVAQIDANKWLNATALKALVSSSNDLVNYNARLATLVQAQTAYAVLGGYSTVDYITPVSVFAAYDALANKTLYTTKNVYDATSAKLNSWMTNYSLDYADKAGKANINYIVGSATKYGEYLDNQKKVNALNEKYADFTSNIVTRVLAFEKLTVINDTNIAEHIAIDKAVTEWKKVWAADSSKGIAEFNVDNANFAEMIKNGFSDDRTTLFIYNKDVKDFYLVTYAAASAYAKKVNDQIDAFAKDLKDGKNFNTVLELKKLYGYVVSDATKGYYKLASKATAELAVATIKSFQDIYKTDKYDLTSLLKLDVYDATLKTVEDRIAAYKATAADITSQYDAILKQMKTDKITVVNLNYETSVNKVYNLYAGMTGFNAEMASWGLVKDKTDVYEFTTLLKQETYEGVYELRSDIARLRDAADKLAEYYGVLTEAFVYTKVAAADDVDDVDAYTDKHKSADGKTSYFSYIKSVAKVDSKYVYTYVTDATSDATTIMTIADAAEMGDTIYNWFIAQNGGKKYEAVETARAAAFDAQKLLVVKSYAIKAVLATVQGTNYDKTFGFNVCQETAVAKILAVNSIKAVADELHHFVVEAGATAADATNGAYIAAITFGADKDGKDVTVIGVNGDGVELK